MGQFIKEDGKMDWCMEKEIMAGKMDRNIKEAIFKAKNKEKVLFITHQVKFIKECGLMESNKAKVKLWLKMDKPKNKVFGKLVIFKDLLIKIRINCNLNNNLK